MPYSMQRRRDHRNQAIFELVEILKKLPLRDVAGELNYIITKIIVSLFHARRSYAMGNVITGALSCAAREFARRHLDKLENEKIKENGDVKPL